MPHPIIQQINFIYNPKKNENIVYFNICVGKMWQSNSWNNIMYLLKLIELRTNWLTNLFNEQDKLYQFLYPYSLYLFWRGYRCEQHKNFQSNWITFITSKSLVMFPYNNHLLRQLATFHKKVQSLYCRRVYLHTVATTLGDYNFTKK